MNNQNSRKNASSSSSVLKLGLLIFIINVIFLQTCEGKEKTKKKTNTNLISSQGIAISINKKTSNGVITVPSVLADLKKEVVSYVKEEKKKKKRKRDGTMRAIVHIGPLETGSKGIQYDLQQYKQMLLQEDQYEIASSVPNRVTTYGLRFCFSTAIQQQQQSNKCSQTLLQNIQNIAERGNNIIISAENLAFTFPEFKYKEFKQFLSPWKKQSIIVYYRRFYDWYYSQWKVFYKLRSSSTNINNNNNSSGNQVDFVTQTTQQFNHGHPTKNKLEYTYRGSFYTYGLVTRWKKYFSNVKVYNTHDQTLQTNSEKFFCNATKAIKTCQAYQQQKKKKLSNNIDSTSRNLFNQDESRALIYEDLARTAIQMGFISSISDITQTNQTFIDTLSERIQDQQENVWKLSQYNFPQNATKCLDDDVLDYLLNRTLEAEKRFFPDFYTSAAGEQTIRKQFAVDKVTKLCSIHARIVLEQDPKWKQFFQSI